MSYSGFREQIRCIVSVRGGWVCDITSIRQSEQTYSCWQLVYYGGAIRGGKIKIYVGRSSTVASVANLRPSIVVEYFRCV